MARPIITLLTDFGIDDTYVGQMKGVIAGIAPEAIVVDLTHTVHPQAIEQGAFLLEGAIEAFPADAIHLAVVDPGVGTRRAGLVLRTRGWTFVGPDNGLLSCALPPDRRPTVQSSVPLPAEVEAVVLRPPDERAVAATFHGRDVFAVATAHIASGRALSSLGDPVDRMIALPPFRAGLSPGGELLGRIVHIDRFGNVITSVHASQLHSRLASVRLGTTRITDVVTTYADGQGLVALIGSSGFLEVAEVNGSAAAALDCTIGDVVVVEAQSSLSGA